MFDLIWVCMLVQTRNEPISRERQREFEQEQVSHISFGGLKAIIRSFMPW